MKSDVTYNLDNKKWILTDFFDTLVHRTVSEKEIRAIWAKDVSKKLNGVVSVSNLIRARKYATIKLAQKSIVEELKYEDIMSQMYLFFRKKISLSAEKFVGLCITEETRVEMKHLYLDKEMVSFLREQYRKGKRIAIVSDFYMSKEQLLYFIKRLGIADIISRIFVSCDYGVKKKSGNLYKIVIKELGKPCDLIMYGDNKIADYYAALKNGIDSHLREVVKPLLVELKNQLDLIYKEGKQFPFANYAFIYFLYIDRMYKRLLEIKPQKIFFLAREGYFLIKLFKLYQSKKEIQFDAEYLYVSRRSTILPSLAGVNETEFRSIFNSYRDLDIVSFLKNLSFTNDEIEKVTTTLSFDCEKVFYGLKDTKEFQMLLANEQFKIIIDEKCEYNKSLFQAYMKQSGLKSGEEIIIIDVGWKGTIQDNIYKALNEEYVVRGLYLGYENYTGYENSRNIKEGLIFSKYPCPSQNYSIWDFETHLIEQILAAPHGSTYGYRKVSSFVKPVLEEYTIEDRELYDIAEPVQSQIYMVFSNICKVFSNVYLSADDLGNEFLFKHLKTLLLLNNKCIEFEKVALTPKTNNFGWFKCIPTRDSKVEKFRSMLKDLKEINASGLGFMSYVSYFSIKLNARHKYRWKKYIYRIVYAIEYFCLKEETDVRE